MIHLKGVQLNNTAKREDFPYNVPVIRALDAITFDSDVTFLVGENGSGKSTLLEAIACAAGSVTVGSEDTHNDPTLTAIRKFAKSLKLQWTLKKIRRGFFMRSEDFFGYVKRIGQMRAELQTEIRQVDEDYQDRSALAQGLAKMPYTRELRALEDSYGADLDAHSHGESYFTLFKSRFVPGGLYLLDEPEAPLSPNRQLALLALLKQMVDQDSQFIIATHSPIIMAYPGATILSFDEGRMTQVPYDELEHVTLTRSFLNDPTAFLRHLMA